MKLLAKVFHFLVQITCIADYFNSIVFFILCISVPLEATAFLAAVSAFAVFLLVIFMYVNKKWHLFNINVGSPVATLRDMDGNGIGNRNGPSSLYPSVKSLQMNNVNLKSQSK